MQKIASTLALFTSFGTLLCCALPALLVTLGLGAALAGLVNEVPQLVWFSENKDYFFVFSALMLSISGFALWKTRNAPCPVDPDKAKACGRLRKVNIWVYSVSIAIYVIGFFFAYIAQHILI